MQDPSKASILIYPAPKQTALSFSNNIIPDSYPKVSYRESESSSLEFLNSMHSEGRELGSEGKIKKVEEIFYKRKASDSDSFIQSSSFVTVKNCVSQDSSETPLDTVVKCSKDSLRGSLPILGATPVTAYCRFCKAEVSTVIDVNSIALPNTFVRTIASFFNCCRGPQWLCNLQVHKCSNCNLVVGKTR